MIGFKLPDTAGWSVEVETERISQERGNIIGTKLSRQRTNKKQERCMMI